MISIGFPEEEDAADADDVGDFVPVEVGMATGEALLLLERGAGTGVGAPGVNGTGFFWCDRGGGEFLYISALLAGEGLLITITGSTRYSSMLAGSFLCLFAGSCASVLDRFGPIFTHGR